MTVNKKHILFWSTLLLCAVLASFFYFNKEETAQQGEVELATITRGTIQDVITAQGTLEPKDYVDVGVQVSGQLKKLYVDIGDTIKKGDLLAELDPQIYQSAVEGDGARIHALDAQMDQQKAQLDYDKMQYDRAKKLIKSQAISKQELEDKEKAFKISQATLAALAAQKEEAEASLKSNQINLGYTKIYAPMSGIISDKIAREGQTLNANQTTPTIVQIANLDIMTIRAEIAEADITRLRTGMSSDFSTLGSERKWKGIVRQILPTPEVVNDVVLYNALIDVENKDYQLMNGMSTQNTFIVDHAENVLLIPTRALGTRDPSQDNPDRGLGYKVRLLNKNKRAEEKTILVGVITRSHAEVISGLSEGDVVIVSGLVNKATERTRPLPGIGRL